MKILTYILKTVWLTLWFELRSATDYFAQCFMKLFSKIKKAWALSLITFFSSAHLFFMTVPSGVLTKAPLGASDTSSSISATAAARRSSSLIWIVSSSSVASSPSPILRTSTCSNSWLENGSSEILLRHSSTAPIIYLGVI